MVLFIIGRKMVKKDIYMLKIHGMKMKIFQLKKLKKDFDEMIFQCGENLDAKNRKDLFIFCYAVAKGWIK